MIAQSSASGSTLRLLAGIAVILVMLSVPLLGLLAYRGCGKQARSELAAWRRALGLASIVFTFLGWVVLVIPPAIHWIGSNTNVFPDSDGAVLLMAATGTCLAFALKGKPRIQAGLMGLVVLALWYISATP